MSTTKLIFISIIHILSPIDLYAVTSGPLSGSTFTNVALSGSSASWLNISNAGMSDDIYVSIPANGLSSNGQYTDYLQVTNFGFSIPSGYIINGISIEIERGDINNAKDYAVRIVKSGTIGTTDRSLMPAWSTEAYVSYGGATDLWGTTWTYSDINSLNFGVAFSCKKQGGGANPAPKVDHVRISITYTNALPIDLLNFNADYIKDMVHLSWTTASETNNDFFTIEKSKNGIEFEFIASVDGAGNSKQILHYSYLDQDPYPEISYYRLKQTDFDGKFEYSKLLAVEAKKADTSILTIFPNPNTGESIAIEMSVNKNEEIMVKIFDINSCDMHSEIVIPEDNGRKVLTFAPKEKLSPGIYILNVTSRRFNVAKRMVVR
jgi:hypothetical protein